MRSLNELVNTARLELESAYWYVDQDGYIVALLSSGIVSQHRLIAEIALGKQLPVNAEVHHYNGNRGDNRYFNLIVCPNKEYHDLLHERAKKVFDTVYSQETYTAIKKASWEHRHRYEPWREYKTFKQIKARANRRVLESKEWWPFKN